MTKDKRGKREARDRSARTGEPYAAARRRTALRERLFEADNCANCLEALPDEVDGLFCGELCRQTADTVRYWRRVLRDGRAERPDVQEAVRTRTAFLLAGGYDGNARRLSKQTRLEVWGRDGGVCQSCGEPGAEIDHIDGDSSDLSNLQLLCTTCHHAKTAQRMHPASEEQAQIIQSLFRTRVVPDDPALLADDEIRWQKEWAGLKTQRRQRLLDEMLELGLDPADFRGATRSEMVTALHEAIEDEQDALDDGGWSEDDDTGYGPYSYFAHAMAKDD